MHKNLCLKIKHKKNYVKYKATDWLIQSQVDLHDKGNSQDFQTLCKWEVDQLSTTWPDPPELYNL